METAAVPKLTVSFAVDLELEYDSFTGKTPKQIAEAQRLATEWMAKRN